MGQKNSAPRLEGGEQLGIFEYFSAKEVRAPFDKYYGGTTEIRDWLSGQHHFVVHSGTGGRSTRKTTTIHDSINSGVQTKRSSLLIRDDKKLVRFLDTQCMLYSIYTQARSHYGLPRELFTVKNESALYALNKKLLDKATDPQKRPLSTEQKKELARLLANRQLLVALFRKMEKDETFYKVIYPVWKESHWTIPRLKEHFPRAVSAFSTYTFGQHVPSSPSFKLPPI